MMKKPKDSVTVELPEPKVGGMPVEEAISKRRSVRDYSTQPLNLLQISQLLHSAQGITGEWNGLELRSAPSAGALYPYEIYLIVNHVENLPPGIYHYGVEDHQLERMAEGDFRKAILEAGLGQESLATAAVNVVLAAVFERVTRKYGDRGMRFVYMEAGHISQNIYLQSVSLGLGSVAIGAFSDRKMNQLIGMDGVKEAVIYLQSVGYPAQS